MPVDSKNDRERFLNLALDGSDPETARQMTARGLELANQRAWVGHHRGWFLHKGPECYLCQQLVESRAAADILSTYWGSYWTLIHKACRPLYRAQIEEMQDVDKSCNDCGWFKRESGQAGHCVNPKGAFHGRVYAHAVMAHVATSGCFQHRRLGTHEGVVKDTPLQSSMLGCLFPVTLPSVTGNR
jgi:hypothetical protein